MRLTFRDATLNDVPIITALHNAAAGALTARFGEGHWYKGDPLVYCEVLLA
jgi:hypothetical protein